MLDAITFKKILNSGNEGIIGQEVKLSLVGTSK